MKISYLLLSLSLLFFSCKENPTQEEKGTFPFCVNKLNDVIVRGDSYYHKIDFNKNLINYDSIVLKPDSLSYTVDSNILSIKPKNNILIGHYKYAIILYKDGESFLYQDSFYIENPYANISNVKLNFLIVGEKNPISISVGYYSIKGYKLTSDDDLLIEKVKKTDFRYYVTPHSIGEVKLKIKIQKDGMLETLATMTFIVIDSDSKLSKLIKLKRHANNK